MKAFVSEANRLYQRALDLVLRVDASAALNLDRPTMPGNTGVAAELLTALQMIKGEAFDATSGSVRYERLKHSESYRRYRACTARLIRFQPRTLTSRQERLAFWINLYNALIIDAVIAFDVRTGVREDLGFFRRAAYVIGGLRYSADDIEHGILRGNRRHFHPAVWFPQFAPDDARLVHTIRPLDPRVHCALVCASRSCPPFRTYEAEQVDAQLETAALHFVNSGGGVQVEGRLALLSPIFKWYRKDFRGKNGVREFILRFLDDGPARKALQARECRLRYQRYDWSLNRV